METIVTLGRAGRHLGCNLCSDIRLGIPLAWGISVIQMHRRFRLQGSQRHMVQSVLSAFEFYCLWLEGLFFG